MPFPSNVSPGSDIFTVGMSVVPALPQQQLRRYLRNLLLAQYFGGERFQTLRRLPLK